MKSKLIKAMLNICGWIADDIGMEVDKEDFINKIKADLVEVDGEIQEDDIIIKMFEDDFLKGFYEIIIEVDLDCNVALKVTVDKVDFEGFRIKGFLMIV